MSASSNQQSSVYSGTNDSEDSQETLRFAVVSLAALDLPIGEAITSIRLARAFANWGHAVTLLAPTVSAAPVIDPSPARVRHTWNLTCVRLPNSLNALVQFFYVFGMCLRKEIDVVYLRGSSVSFVFGVLRLLFPGVVLVSEHHGWASAERKLSGRLAWLASLEQGLQILDAKCAHLVRTVVSGIKDRLADGGVAPDKILVVGNACDTELIAAASHRDRTPQTAEEGVIGFVGSLTPWQGLEEVVTGFAKILESGTRARLVLIGDGPCREQLTAQAQQLGIADRIDFRGRVDHHNIGKEMADFDIAVMPTHSGAYSEIGRSPLKLREYAAAGCVVLAAQIGGVADLAQQSWMYYYTAGDAEQFAAEARRLLADQPGLHDAGKHARQYAEENFSWPVISKQILQAVQSVHSTLNRTAQPG